MNIGLTWNKLNSLPAGGWAFSKLLSLYVPYTGSVGAIVKELRPGYARVTLKERWKVRNHLKSIHAVALMNLCEMTSGLAMLAGLPDDVRSIVTDFHITYKKKARGLITAVGECEIPRVEGKMETKSHVKVFSGANELLCEATATWLLDKKL